MARLLFLRGVKVTIQFLRWNETGDEAKAKLLRRAETDIRDLFPLAQDVIEKVRAGGDKAVVKFARKFDAPKFRAGMLRAKPADFKAARRTVAGEVIQAIEAAHVNIERFHQEQMPEPMWFMQVAPGIMAGEKITPVTSAALYVPRGKGAFPSVMMMLATPAKVAGVPRLVVVTPPTPEGKADAASLVAAEVCGIEEVYVVGGMQAIAALAYGTETIPKVAKIVGPGSSYVSAAKRLLYGTVDVGLPAGPSEAIILADETADARLCALDLLIEAEHGRESASLLVTHDERLASAVVEELPHLIGELPEWRRAFVESVLANYGGIVLTESLQQSIDFVNEYAPEHMEVLTSEPFVTLQKLNNAGEILLGHYTPVAAANYALGINAVLPTGGFARSFSSVSVWDFLKRSSIGYLSREGYAGLQGTVATLADYEDFPAHAMAIRKRNAILGI
jgi:histidinol dehydrogenase